MRLEEKSPRTPDEGRSPGHVETRTVRRLEADDVDAADRVMRTAFGTYLGLTEPTSFGGDAECVRIRARARHVEAFVVADPGEAILGSSMVTRWGSFAFVGPVSVDPAHWDGGLGSRLMEPVADQIDSWGVPIAGLFTFANSAKHIGLYQRFGFYPRALTALMLRSVGATEPPPATFRLSAASRDDRAALLQQAASVSGAVYHGLDLTCEIEQLVQHDLGDVVVVEDDGAAGFAICHLGAGSEAGSNVCYVKFAAVGPGRRAAVNFTALLAGCEALAHAHGAATVLAGVSTARQYPYEAMLARGYRGTMYGVAMHRRNDPGFSRPDDYVLDDWR